MIGLTEARLRALLRANQAVVEHLDLSVVLRRIAEAAVELVGAQYGALGVISPAGGLEEFIHVGIPDDRAAQIGHLPEGHGLLGALIDDPTPIRLPHLSGDHRSAGFPRHHPPMDSFLGVPIRVGDDVFGNLYLTNREGGQFTEDDEKLVTQLASTAGFAIQHARLYSETDRRRAWASASAEVTSAMLSADPADAISVLVSRVVQLSDADLVFIVIDGGDDYVISVADGTDAAPLVGTRLDKAGSLTTRVLEGAQPVLVHDASGMLPPLDDGRSIGPLLGLPLVGETVPDGVLFVARLHGRVGFSRSDLEMTADFAGQASIALELIRARSAQQSMMLLDDRSRIARDLHDHVIQQLFGSGLELQGVAAATQSPAMSARLHTIVEHLDDAIAQIRTVIFALTPPTPSAREGIRHQLIDLASDVAPALAIMPSVSFTGPVDLAVQGRLADEIIAVSREGLTNAAKHANAQRTGLTLAVTSDAVVLTITDDGSGIRGSRRSGLANLDERATRRGGTFTIDTGHDGTRLVWSVPLSEDDA